MTSRKERLTVTVDRDVLAAGDEAVTSGRAESLSAWVNAALLERVAKERRLAALSEAVALYEVDFGVISAAEMLTQADADRDAALRVRRASSRAKSARSSTPKSRGAA